MLSVMIVVTVLYTLPLREKIQERESQIVELEGQLKRVTDKNTELLHMLHKLSRFADTDCPGYDEIIRQVEDALRVKNGKTDI